MGKRNSIGKPLWDVLWSHSICWLRKHDFPNRAKPSAIAFVSFSMLLDSLLIFTEYSSSVHSILSNNCCFYFQFFLSTVKQLVFNRYLSLKLFLLVSC